MDIQEAIIAFDALSQETRLRVHRLLVESGPEGLPAGELSKALGIPHNTLSFHLNHMGVTQGLYHPDAKAVRLFIPLIFEFVTDLIRFMVENCCNVDFANIREGKQKGSSVIEIMNCCQPKKEKKS